jgi:hypothetical protein
MKLDSSTNKDSPYLSIVAATRNDNHGGDLLKRTVCFVKGIFHQAKKFNFPIELIIVEWNPPEGKPLLKDVLPRPGKDDLVSLRYIVVPNEMHRTFKNADVLPLHQMIAKNVGIRRARGKFVLCTNIDILFSNGCFQRLAERNLKPGYFYRTTRSDVPKAVMEIEDIEEQLKYSRKNIIKRLGLRADYKSAYILHDLFFWMPNVLYFIERFFGLLLRFLFLFSKAGRRNINFLNVYACGDFTIMSKEDWHKIDGYYESAMFPLHVDTMALIGAYAIGMEQETFSRASCIYHIYHETGWDSDYKKPEEFIKLMEKRPGLDWHGVKHSGKKLISEKRNYQLNDKDWGLHNQELKEYVFD